jgi:NADPH:quinone reductase-like Zn-dependent oxidoreductase
MKAAVITTPGTEPVYGDFAEPQESEQAQLMQVLAAGIHPVVRSLASGRHYGSEGAYPLVPGVDAVARGADGTARYAGFVRAPWGTIAERIAAPIGVALPDGADPVTIAGALNPGLSSWLPLTRRSAEVGRLGTVLVVGGTGVAGRMAVQNALLLGAERVIGVGRDTARLAEVQLLGGIAVPLSNDPGPLASALAGTAPSIVLDYVWGPGAEMVWAALGRRRLGDDTADIRHVQIGAPAGMTAALPSTLLRSRRITVQGGGAGSTPVAEIIAALPPYMSRLASGQVRVPIRTYPLRDVARAWADRGPERVVIVPG